MPYVINIHSTKTTMNTTLPNKPVSLSLGLLCAALLANTAVAGPGPQYWLAQGKPKAAPVVSLTKAAVAPVTLCAGAKVVPSTIMKPALANGKGPLVSVQVGIRTVCRMCPVTTLVTKGSFGNGKGPMETKEVTKVGVEHNCATCTGTPGKS